MKKRIEIIALNKERIYSIGAIEISKNGDVYHAYKIYGSDIHCSRHADGKKHWKSEKKFQLFQKLGEGASVKSFAGIEYLGTMGLDLNTLPEVYKEYKMRKCNGLFAIDVREYKNSFFNMSVAILTKEGLPSLYSFQDFRKHQIYIFTDSNPMIAIAAFEAKDNKKD